MKHISTLLPAVLLSALGARAQYCSPTFTNGCFSWTTLSVSLGSLAWDLNGGDCSLSDHTDISTAIVAGEPTAMTVVNGTWCGCAVWVDLDNSGSFEDTENLYTIYVGGSPSYTYDFPLTIPEGTAPGSYRMRIISPWGSDGITVGDNGYGPCGSYQYGNFEDFTLEVTATTSIAGLDSASPVVSAGPNPTTGKLTLKLGENNTGNKILLENTDGRLVREWNAMGTRTLELDLGDVPSGIYLVRGTSGSSARPLRILKQ
jgi:hypothetical protein